MQPKEYFGRQIKTMRESKGWTQEVLGKQCNVKRAQISKIESGILSKPELRLLKIAELFGCELHFIDSSAPQQLWLHPERDSAYRTTICDLLRKHDVHQIDMLQFSGFTAIPVLETVANRFPNANIRLLLASPDTAALYGWNNSEDFHQRRIRNTEDHCDIIMRDVVSKKKDAKFTIEIWHYSVTPSIAGIIVDDWLVSVGWYSIYPSPESPTGVAILGHKLPAITVIEEKAQPFLPMVRDQFEALVSNRPPNLSLRLTENDIEAWQLRIDTLLES